MVHDCNYAKFRVLQLSLEEAHGPCSAAAAELEGNIEGLKQELALVSEQLRASLAAEEKSREQVICLDLRFPGHYAYSQTWIPTQRLHVCCKNLWENFLLGFLKHCILVAHLDLAM